MVIIFEIYFTLMNARFGRWEIIIIIKRSTAMCSFLKMLNYDSERLYYYFQNYLN